MLNLISILLICHISFLWVGFCHTPGKLASPPLFFSEFIILSSSISSRSFCDHFITHFGLLLAGSYLPRNTCPEPDRTLFQSLLCKIEEHRKVITVSYRQSSCLYIPKFMGFAEPRCSSPMHVVWDKWLIAVIPFLLCLTLHPPKKGHALEPCFKICAGALKSFRYPSGIMLRTVVNKRWEETFIKLLFLTITAEQKVSKSLFTSISIILGAFLFNA